MRAIIGLILMCLIVGCGAESGLKPEIKDDQNDYQNDNTLESLLAIEYDKLRGTYSPINDQKIGSLKVIFAGDKMGIVITKGSIRVGEKTNDGPMIYPFKITVKTNDIYCKTYDLEFHYKFENGQLVLTSESNGEHFYRPGIENPLRLIKQD